MNNYYVYRYVRLDTNTPFYIGKGSKDRYKDVKNGRTNYFKHIVKKTKYKVEIILKDLDEEKAYEKEIEFIKMYKKYGYCQCNFSLGGRGALGIKRSKNAIEKTKLSNLGRKHTEESRINYKKAAIDRIRDEKELNRVAELGKRYGSLPKTEEHKKKISNAHKGKKRSKEHIENMSKSNMGKKLSQETINKIVAKNKGRKCSEKQIEQMRNRRHSEETKQKMRESALKRKNKDIHVNQGT